MIHFSNTNAKEFTQKILQGDVVYLARALTLLESTQKEHQQLAEEILESCLPQSGNSIRIGITGVPGVGKSTFIEALGKKILSDGKKIAVLAVDPSSKKNKGSILGDKTRMEELSKQKNVFIRPSPAGETLGGVTNTTRESIVLMEAAGYDVILIETVGVGQSETAVHSMTDIFLLLMLAGAGDELQGIKRGIMELADIICITKADGDNMEKAKLAQADFKRAVHLFSENSSGMQCIVETCSALHDIRIDIIWKHIQQYISAAKTKSYFYEKRKQQALEGFIQTLQNLMLQKMRHNKNLESAIADTKQAVAENKILPSVAARKIIEFL